MDILHPITFSAGSSSREKDVIRPENPALFALTPIVHQLSPPSLQSNTGTLLRIFPDARSACSSCREDARKENEEHVRDRKLSYVYFRDKDRLPTDPAIT